MMVKNGIDFFYFEIERVPSELLLPSAKKFIQERLNWPGRLAGPLILAVLGGVLPL